MDLQYISIGFYSYIFGGILFFFYLEKVIKDIIANDELFEELQEAIYKSNGLRLTKDFLWTSIHTPKVMLFFILIYPVLILSMVYKALLKIFKGDESGKV